MPFIVESASPPDVPMLDRPSDTTSTSTAAPMSPAVERTTTAMSQTKISTPRQDSEMTSSESRTGAADQCDEYVEDDADEEEDEGTRSGRDGPSLSGIHS